MKATSAGLPAKALRSLRPGPIARTVRRTRHWNWREYLTTALKVAVSSGLPARIPRSLRPGPIMRTAPRHRNRNRNRRKHLTTALKVAVSSGLLAWVIRKIHPGPIGHSLAGASPVWLGFALLLGIAATLIQAIQWRRLLLAVGLGRTLARSLRVVFIGNTFNTVLPSSIGGDAARAVYIAERPGEKAPAAAAVVLQRLLNFPGMVLLMGLGLALTATSPAGVRAWPVALTGTVIGLAILAVALSPLLGRIAGSARLARLPGGNGLSASLRVLDGFRAQRAEAAGAAGRGTAFWSLTVLNQWCYMRAMGIHPSLQYAAVAVTLVNGLTMLPISINGYGARESGYTALLAGAGLASASQAVSVGLLVSAQSLLFGLIGVGCLLSGHRTAPTARRVGAAVAAGAASPHAVTGQWSRRRLLRAATLAEAGSLRTLLRTLGALVLADLRRAATSGSAAVPGPQGIPQHGVFLRARELGHVAKACREAGISRSTYDRGHRQ